MRNLLLSIASSVLLFSCDKSSERETIRRIVNMTEYSLEIKILSEDTLFYFLAPWGSLDIKGVCYGPPDRFCNVGWPGTADYGEIVFNKKFKQIFELLPYPGCSDKSIIRPPDGNCYGYNFEKKKISSFIPIKLPMKITKMQS